LLKRVFHLFLSACLPTYFDLCAFTTDISSKAISIEVKADFRLSKKYDENKASQQTL
jgi:hypothetical protein